MKCICCELPSDVSVCPSCSEAYGRSGSSIDKYVGSGSPDGKHNYLYVECSLHGIISSMPIGSQVYWIDPRDDDIHECFYCNGEREVPLPNLTIDLSMKALEARAQR